MVPGPQSGFLLFLQGSKTLNPGISCLLKSGQVSNALENGEITLLFPKDIPFPVTSGLEHPSTFLLSPPRGQEGHPQWRQARENTARGVGKSSRIDPRCC